MSDIKHLSGILGFKWQACHLSQLCHLRKAHLLSDIKYLSGISDISGKPRAGFARVSFPFFLSGMKYLSDTDGFKWHVPLKSVMSLKKNMHFLSGMKYSSGMNGFKWHAPLKSDMSLKKMRIVLTDLTDLTDLCGKPRAGLARVSFPLFLSGMKYLSGINGFKWHVPLKSLKSLKKNARLFK